MLYERGVINQKELDKLLEKCERRKGRLAKLSECKTGDLVRRVDEKYRVFQVEIDRSDCFTLTNVHEMASLVKFVSHVSRDAAGAKDVLILTKPEETYIPQYESAITTLVYRNEDGSVCCQNIVAWHEGQHFSFVSVEEFEAFVQNESSKQSGNAIRKWVQESGPCPLCKKCVATAAS